VKVTFKLLNILSFLLIINFFVDGSVLLIKLNNKYILMYVNLLITCNEVEFVW